MQRFFNLTRAKSNHDLKLLTMTTKVSGWYLSQNEDKAIIFAKLIHKLLLLLLSAANKNGFYCS
jgi:hypothetical protein